MPDQNHRSPAQDLQRSTYLEREYSLRKSLVVATWCTFGALIIYAGFTLGVWWSTKNAADAAKKSADTAYEALVAGERPWVTFSPDIQPQPHPVREGSTTIRTWGFSVPIINSGATPTVGMVDHASVETSEEPLPPDFDFHDFEGGEYTLAPPKGTLSYVINDIDPQKLVTNRVYVYGWATYRDRFPGTELHSSKFCFESEPVGPGALSIRGVTVWRFRFCDRHNCTDADEGCRKGLTE